MGPAGSSSECSALHVDHSADILGNVPSRGGFSQWVRQVGQYENSELVADAAPSNHIRCEAISGMRK
jgi:hypothetical protein